ncbi:glycine zipper domain-containing protein [Pinisolibacter aquiterrae]|uniref:glycine zipper domain-containing protein n=1 Tax=Pinisolibacter aquiterrae TaxID=2815579 RepID=UPI001C3E67F8|nr:bacteriocin [Pinisolibacter aquiterrae]MBV5262506.1 bacteriocin [Pinisolibacter aquiterrae]MCC8235859.1 bacteriocin [Pinisolibacter aquiterrae]
MNATWKKFLLPCALALTLGACANARDTRMAEGAGLGGAGGALIGGIASNSVGGAVVGGVAGAAVGAVVADATRPRHAKRHCYFSDTLNRRVCRYR